MASKFEDQLLEDLLREHGPALAAARPPVPPRHRGRWVAAAATVAALVAAVLVVQTVPFGDRPAASRAVADVLTRAADRIGASDPHVGPGQYLYLESHEWNLVVTDEGDDTPVSYLQESITQTWVPHDRSREWLQRTRETNQRRWIHGSEADLRRLGLEPDGQRVEQARARCGDFHLETGMRPCEDEGGSWQEPTPAFVAALPTDPQQLYDELLDAMDDEGAGPDLAVLDFVQDSIHRGLMPADLRANLYRALAWMPALEVSDRDANLDGRTGVGLGVEGAGRRHELIIDPASGQFIGERVTTTRDHPEAPAGTVMSYSSLSTGVADRMGAEPRR